MTGSVNGIQLGSKGRLVVPAALRRELGINAGERNPC
jgi:bifunctional DNA-binding transcriptional regulator/antitoxin component of YhaV-PrlF toxin-antitoxin module